MAQTYPYLDLCALPALRHHVVSPRAALLIERDGNAFIWANGEGVKLAGAENTRALLDGEGSFDRVAERQIAAARAELDDHAGAKGTMRLRRGFKTQLVGFTLERVELPDGTEADLLTTDPLHGRGHRSADMAGVAVECLDGEHHGAAILDHIGTIVSSSASFTNFAIGDDQRDDLLETVRGSGDTVVKRRLQATGQDLACGIARLSEEPASYLLLVADAANGDESLTMTEAAPDEARFEAEKPTVDMDDNVETASDAGEAIDTSASVDEPSGFAMFSNKRSVPTDGPMQRWYLKRSSQDDAADDEETAAVDHTADDGSSEAGVSTVIHTARSDTGMPDDEAATEPEAVHEEPIDVADAVATLDGVDAYEIFETPADDDDTGVDETIVGSERGERTDGHLYSVDENTEEPGGFVFEAQSKPTRFAWEMDADLVFTSVSESFAQTVGPRSADIVGSTWRDIATRRGFDNVDEIETLLTKGDTWSGRTVLWPIDDQQLAIPVDLAGLPAYDRDRNFSGFNGFGIARTADAMLHVPFDEIDDDLSRQSDPNVPESDAAGSSVANDHSDDSGDAEGSDLANRSERNLSSGEQAVFKRIGDELGETEPDPVSDLPDTDVEPDAATDEAAQRPSEMDRVTERKADASDAGVHPIGFLPSAFARKPSDGGQPAAPDEEGPLTSADEGSADHDEPDGDRPLEPAVSSNDNLDAPLVARTDDEGSTTDDRLQEPTVSDSEPAFLADRSAPRPPAHVLPVPANVDTSILSRLPIPVLVYRDDALMYANTEFFEVTGWPELDDLAEAGGIEHLLGASDTLGSSVSTPRVFHRDGHILSYKAHLQSVPWNNERAMLLTLRADDGGGPDDDDGPDDETHADPDDGPEADGVDEDQPTVDQPTSRADTDNVLRTSREPFGGLDAEDLRGILDVATDGVIILSEEGVVRALNGSAEALFDVEPDDIIGHSIVRLLAPESKRPALDYVGTVTSKGVRSLLNDGREIIGRTRNGGLVPLFMTIGKLERTSDCCAVVRDITQWKKTEEELTSARAKAEESNRQKTDFLALISHEIRTPLNAVIGFSELMIEERFGPIENDKYLGYVRDINRSGKHVLELVNDLLDISKIEAGKLDLNFDAVELNALVSETVALNQPEANKQRVIIRTSLSAAVPKIVADSRSLKQIVLNLVANAVAYTRSGGQVIVSTVYDDSGEVVIRVRDTGVGMSENDLKRALRPFEQGGNHTMRNNNRGTGLGLPLTKALVEANRAYFSIESEPERGTLVEVHFPAQRVLADP